MTVTVQREMDRLERWMVFLASVGSVAPFIGLFGTVWGIMNSFAAIAGMQNTNLAVVAPGIAEALFATAIGLVAAIPAVLAYNKITTDLSRFAGRLEGFASEFGAILSRQTEAVATAAPGTRRRRRPSRRRSSARWPLPSTAAGRRAPQRPLPADGRDQRHAAGRRDAGAAHHLHGGGAADDGRACRSTCRRPRPAPLNQENEPITITVNPEGQIFLQETEVPIEGLVPQLQAIAGSQAGRHGAPHLRARRPRHHLWPGDGGHGHGQRRRLLPGGAAGGTAGAGRKRGPRRRRPPQAPPASTRRRGNPNGATGPRG